MDRLWKLQDLDDKLAALEKRAATLDQGERARAHLEAHEGKLRELEEETARLTARQAELEAESERNDAAPGPAQRQRREQLDEELLQIMDRLPQLDSERPRRAEAVGEAREDLQLRLEEARHNLQVVEARRREWGLAREELVRDLEWTTAYDHARKKWGQAVIAMQKGACGGCRMALPDADLRRVQAQQVVQCGTCGRFVGKTL